MNSVLFRGATIRFADLRIEKEGAVFARIHLKADFSEPVREAFGWDEIPEGITSAKLVGELATRNLVLSPNDKQLRKQEIQFDCMEVSDFQIVAEKNDDGEVTGHRLTFVARSGQEDAIVLINAYLRIVGKGDASLKLSYEKQEKLPGLDAGPAQQEAPRSMNEQMAADYPEQDEPETEQEAAPLASAVSVAGSTHELKKERKRRSKGKPGPDPGAENFGMPLRTLKLEEDSVSARIEVADHDGVLTWNADANIRDSEGCELTPDDGTEPPLSVAQAIVAAANRLGAWAGFHKASHTDKDVRHDAAVLAAWCVKQAGEARVEGRTAPDPAGSSVQAIGGRRVQ